ncbi:hypothetical protein ELH93_22140 [Rhizobium leguminosarum]|uniref:Uncharacterized protein n=1 Tax=Rhizobium leguminosarum TaxID=384 RepID=A0ABD7PWZ4_RHILE|nr:hypothetical protein ELI19_22140 [Rhizobium leguminosarum]TAW45774.1 hypothetical protein ELI18_22110 [Rhizobium leguminosarum]TAY35154.1 hypothetical protein ELH93_22140 [Rhizobium leguminosarum]
MLQHARSCRLRYLGSSSARHLAAPVAVSPHPRIIAGSDFGPIEDSNLSANFRSAENAKFSVKRVSAPDPEHPFQTHFRTHDRLSHPALCGACLASSVSA